MNNIFNFINLHNGEEKKDKVLENVTSNISFRGSNLWILACAITFFDVILSGQFNQELGGQYHWNLHPDHIFAGISDLVNHTDLGLRFRENRTDSLGKSI